MDYEEADDNALMKYVNSGLRPKKPAFDFHPTPSLPEAIKTALVAIENTFVSKNADYAAEAVSWDSNFRDVASQMAWHDPNEAVETLIAVKQARLKSLRLNKTKPNNESLLDTKLDRAVYAVISLAMAYVEEDK